MGKPEAERPLKTSQVWPIWSRRCAQQRVRLWMVGELKGTKGRMRSPFRGPGGLVERWKGRASWLGKGRIVSTRARTEARSKSRGNGRG